MRAKTQRSKATAFLAVIAAIAMAFVMLVGSAGTAFATEAGQTVNTATYTYTGSGATTDGKISVTNATKDTTYTLYKIFDATYSGSNVAYTTSSDTLKNALDSDYFTVSTSKDANGNYSVTRTLKENATSTTDYKKTDAELIAYIKTLATTNFTNIGSIKAPADGTIAWDKIPYGYYYIVPDKPSSQAVVTITSNTPTQEVIDKNQSSTVPDKQESVDGGTNWKYQNTTQETTVPTASIGDTVNYKIVGSFTQYDGSTPITKLTFTDEMSKGLTAKQDVKVKINGTEIASTAYTVTYSTDSTSGKTTTTITIPTATVNSETKAVTAFTYNANNTYEITYSATINKNAAVTDEENNTVTLKYTDNNGTDKTLGTDTTHVKDYKLTINKTNGSSALKGAQFELYRGSSNTTTKTSLIAMTDDELSAVGVTSKVADTVYYRLATSADTSGTTTTIDMSDASSAIIYGLDGTDTYNIKEIKAPNGYNILTTAQAATFSNADLTSTVVNKAGGALPSTGGMGTTILYVVGGLIVAGAVVALVLRRRRTA